ncbi:hypothetical protein QJQ45_016531 [Haematococcus lacustris]|nr:hypothetical protein QJQ45_016531 [Haematococcus lacustris]
MFTIFGPTWVANVQEAGIRYQVLAVPDNKTARLVSGFGVPCFLLDQVDIQDVNTAFHWGSDTWRAHTWQKVAIVRSVNRLGFNVVHSDIDVVWFRDPLDFFTQQHTVPDYMVSMDPITTQNDLGDTGLEKGISVGHYMNTGVYFLRASPGGSALIDKWHSLRAQYIRQYHDQDGLYQYLAKQAVVEYDYPHRVALIKEQGTKLAQLPATLFQNAYSHCINKVHKLHQVQPFETHMVWTYGNNLGKAHRMREYMYFRDPPEYYNTGRYLSVQLSPVTVPPDFNTWNDTVAMAQHHWKSIQQQLSELYYAFALAYTSSRILILPRLTCFCIHNWFESPLCRLPGETITQLPMDCPADYLFNMPVLYNLRMDMRVIRIREYSFLENPRTHHRYKAAPFLISAKELQFPEHKPRHHYLPLKYKDLELNAELERLHAEPRLHVLNPKALFSNFSFPHYQNVFNKLMSSLAIRWCCLPRKDMDRVGIRDEGFQLAVSP